MSNQELTNHHIAESVNTYDPIYLSSKPGLLKLTALIISGICFISSFNLSCSNCHLITILSIIAGLAFWFTLITFLLDLFQVTNRLNTITWSTLEVVLFAIWMLLYILISISMISEDYISSFAKAFSFAGIFIYAFITLHYYLINYKARHPEMQAPNNPE